MIRLLPTRQMPLVWLGHPAIYHSLVRLFAPCLILLFFLIPPPLLAHAAPPPQTDDPAAQCAEGVKLFNNGQYAQALPLLEAGFANRAKASFSNPDDEGLCAGYLGRLRDHIGDRSGALVAYEAALEIFKVSGNRAFEGGILCNIGGVYYYQGHYNEAMNYYQQALDTIRAVGDRTGEGKTLTGIGLIYDSQGRYDEALNYYQQALTIQREVGDRTGEGTILNNIGGVYRGQGRYAQALDYFQQALTIIQEVGDRVTEGMILNNIGEVYRGQGRYAEALENYEQALTIQREVGNLAGEGATLSNIGTVCSDQGRYAEALENYEQALVIRREVGDRAGEGVTLINIGGVYYSQGRYAEALENYEQALVIVREVGNRAWEGMARTSIGLVYSNQGRYAEALENYEQALVIVREVGDRIGEGAILNNIGLVYYNQGRYAEALENYEQALVIVREVGDRVGEGATLINIGAVYSSQGRYVEALKNYEQALVIIREVGDRAREGKTLNNIGLVYYNQGHYAEALENYEQALVIRREVGDRAGEGATLNNIGAVYRGQGYYAEALDYFQEALTIQRKEGDRAEEGTTLSNIGAVYRGQEYYAEALENYEQALDIHREVGDRAGEGTTLSNIGVVYYTQGRYAEALENYQQAIQVVEEIRATAGSEAARASFSAQKVPLYDRILALYHQQGQDEDAFFTAERGRARAFLDELTTGHIQLSDNAAVDLLAQGQEIYAQRQATQDVLAKAKALNPPDPKSVANLEQQLREAEKAYTAAQAAITARGDELADLIPGRNKNVLNVAQVQQLLDPQTILLAYYLLDDKTLAFVLTAKSFQVVELPISRADLTDQVTKFRKFAENKAGDTTRMQAQKLYQTLLAPLAASLATPHLIIVPHQVLHYLPFAALYDEQTGQYLLEKYTLTMLPSASVLQYVTTAHRQPLTAEKQQGSSGAGEPGGEITRVPALVIGNPTVAGPLVIPVPLTGTETTTATVTFDPLKYAEREAKDIAVLYGVQPLLEEAATEGAVRQQVAGARILHLATHGRYNSLVPLDSLIALAPDPITQTTASTSSSGPDAHDGWLTVGEVYGLNLKQTELVVLSACETQVGQLSQGDDVVGLTRAFIFAGTPTVVASLWKVDDEATETLMTQFYTHLQEGLGKAEALRQAQVDLIQSKDGQYTDPYFWAAFVLSGDGATSIAAPALFSVRGITQAIGVWGVGGVGLAVVGLIYGGVWWLRRRKTKTIPPSSPGE